MYNTYIPSKTRMSYEDREKVAEETERKCTGTTVRALTPLLHQNSMQVKETVI